MLTIARGLNLFWIAFGFLVAWYSATLGVWGPAGPDRGFFPFLASMLVSISAAALLMQEWSSMRTIAWRSRGAAVRIIAIIAGMVVMTALIKPLGFVIPVLVATVFFVLVVEPRRWVTALVVGVCVSLISYYVFIQFLGLPFPRGPFGR